MSQKSRAVLKTKFESGRTPTEQDFSDALDSGLNKVDDQISTRPFDTGEEPAVYVGVGTTDPESPISLKNRSGAANLIGFQNADDEAWQIEMDPEEGAIGLNIQETGKNDANLFIQSGGNVGIGIKSPTARLEVKGDFRLLQGEKVDHISNDNTLSANAQTTIPTQQAVKEYIDNLLVGSVSAFATETVPEGWLECNGQMIDRAQYERLFSKIGTSFGQGDGETTFNLPDLRGAFIRGLDHGRGLDPNRVLGSYQSDSIQRHQHTEVGSHNHGYIDCHYAESDGHIYVSGGDGSSRGRDTDNKGFYSYRYTDGASISLSDPTNASTSHETRPRNISLVYYIKF